MDKLLKETYDTLEEIIKIRKTSEEILETLVVTMHWADDYSKKNKIPLSNTDTFSSLINRAESLIEELDNDALKVWKYPTDGFLQRKKTDKDFTEPCAVFHVQRWQCLRFVKLLYSWAVCVV